MSLPFLSVFPDFYIAIDVLVQKARVFEPGMSSPFSLLHPWTILPNRTKPGPSFQLNFRFGRVCLCHAITFLTKTA